MLELKFEFIGTDSGWIDLFFEYGPYKITYSFSDVETKPEELIYWVEKIYNGEFCEFDCSQEDVHWYLDYNGKKLLISDDRNFEGTNIKHEKKVRLQIDIKKDDLCKLIYSSFRKFVKSNLYFRVQWDGETFEEFLIENFGSIDIALEECSKCTLNEFYNKCKNFIPSSAVPLLYFDIFDEYETNNSIRLSETYDSLNLNDKKEFVKKYLNDWQGPGLAEVNLKEVKSEVLDNLLYKG